MSTETTETAAVAETQSPATSAQPAQATVVPPVVVPPGISTEPAKPAKVEMPSDEFKRRLEEERTKAIANYIKGLGVTDEAELKAKVTEAKRLELEKMSDLEKRDVRIKELEPKAQRLADLEPLVKTLADEQEAGLTEQQRAVVVQLAGDDPAKRIGVIKALRSALPPAQIAAPSPSAPQGNGASATKPPIPVAASTAAPPAPPASGTQSPQVDHLATWEALKSRNDGGYSAAMYYNQHTAAIIAAQKARG